MILTTYMSINVFLPNASNLIFQQFPQGLIDHV